MIPAWVAHEAVREVGVFECISTCVAWLLRVARDCCGAAAAAVATCGNTYPKRAPRARRWRAEGRDVVVGIAANYGDDVSDDVSDGDDVDDGDNYEVVDDYTL